MSSNVKFRRKSYIETDGFIIERKLKSIRVIAKEYGWSYDGGGDILINGPPHWIINQSMVHRFGNDEYYRYKNDDHRIDRKYTHLGNDGYHYHESWFEDEPILKLDEEDFFV